MLCDLVPDPARAQEIVNFRFVHVFDEVNHAVHIAFSDAAHLLCVLAHAVENLLALLARHFARALAVVQQLDRVRFH